LLYRYHRLDAARQIAEAQGFKGALFPWESAGTGEESTPSWHKDLDGSIIKIVTMEMERHIVSDIAYAVDNYYSATADREFMLRYGLEIMFETARFWASKVEYNQKNKLYEIKHVIGPDEFHKDVNNNTYTNAMARYNLKEAAKFFKMFKETNRGRLKKIMARIKLKNSEVRVWRKIAMRLKVPIYLRGDLIESFDGYFKKQDIEITQFDSNFMPVFPSGVNVKNVEKTQLIKQADALMLLHLLPDNFSFRQIKANYFYYDRRTMHKSSLSPAIHAIVGSQLGDKHKSYRYFLHSLNTDLKDIHRNTAEGIHAASLGGVWQAVIFGFGGMKVQKGRLCFQPRLPLTWEELKFKIKWHGHALSVFIDKEKIQFYFAARRKKDKIKLKVYGLLRELPANQKTSFYRRSKKR
jgi:kojibiose phosphorylase